MKILHTSDWHIGQLFYNYDRSDEHEFFFDWLVGTIRNYQPDVMVVCGDIFHTAAPSIASQKLYIESLIKIHQAAPDMTLVITSGNHDSGSRIEVDRLLWENFNVRTIGSVARDEDSLDKHIIPIGSPIKGYVVAIPHCYPQNFPSFDKDISKEDRQVAFFKKIIGKTKEKNISELPVVLTAHSTVIGSNPGKQELTVGGIDSIDVEALGDGFDYLALGHIHFPQNVGEKARYCGSPIPVSFNEDYNHSITLLEIENHESEVTKTVLKVPVKRPVLTIPEQAADFEEALKALEAFPDDREAYIRLHVKSVQYGGADWAERALAATSGKVCRYCCLLTESLAAEREGNARNFSHEEFKQVSPLEIAKLHWSASRSEEMDGELVTLLETAIKEIMED